MDDIATKERSIEDFQAQIDDFGDIGDLLVEEMVEYVQLGEQLKSEKFVILPRLSSARADGCFQEA